MSDAATGEEHVKQQLLKAAPSLSLTEERVALTLTRLLAEGEPVVDEQVAQVLGLTPAVGARALAKLRTVVRDDRRRIVACCGLTVQETVHQFDVDGNSVFTWCAWDALMLPELLGSAARATSPCPVTGETVTVAVAPAAPPSARPDKAVLSFILPNPTVPGDPRDTVCRFVNFFSSAEAADEWASHHPGVFVLSLDQGDRLGRAVNRACFPSLAG